MNTYELINLYITGNWEQLARISESELDETQQFFQVAALINCPIKEVMEQWNLFLTQIKLEPRMLITLYNAYQLAEVTLSAATNTELGIKIKKTISDFVQAKQNFFIKAINNEKLFNETEVEVIQNIFKDQLSYPRCLNNDFLEIKNDLHDIYNKMSKNTEKARKFFDSDGKIILKHEQEMLIAWCIQTEKGINKADVKLKNLINKLEKNKNFDNNETDPLMSAALQLNKF